MIESIIIALVALVLGCAGGYALFRYVVKGKYKEMVDAAAKEAEVLKEKKLLEVKEKFLNKKSELEKEVQELRKQVLNLTMNICMELACAHRIRETVRKYGKNKSRLDETTSPSRG